MSKTILITGATDGIGRQAAARLIAAGHRVLVHGRNAAKLADTKASLEATSEGTVESYRADLSLRTEVEALAQAVAEKHSSLDALINNAGVFVTPKTRTPEGLDVRFVVNTIAPLLLTERLLPLLGSKGRVVNVSSAAQAPVDLRALAGEGRLEDFAAYAQSKLALNMWSRHMAAKLGEQGPAIIAVNPGSMLGSKMVKEAFNVAGGDINIGADILCRAALSPEFADASGKYFDNDSGRFADPHADALDSSKSEKTVTALRSVLERMN